MSSPPGTPKKRVSETVSFIKTANPEILRVHPRPGGLLPIKNKEHALDETIGLPQAASTPMRPDLSQAATSSPPEPPAPISEKVSKDFRVQSALEEGESVCSGEDATLPNKLKDAMYVFSVTISSLIMMAAEHPNIPKQYLDWTEHCLEHVRDEFGNHPPNVQGILNQLKYLNRQGGGGKSPPESKGGDEEGGGVLGAADETTNEGDRTDAGARPVDQSKDEGDEDEGDEEDDEDDEQTVRTTTKVKMGSR